MIQTQRENDKLVKTHDSETIAREQEQVNMLKENVELETKSNEASKVLERSEEGLISTRNLPVITQVIVDGSGDSLNSCFGTVISEEIKQMKSKEKSLQQ